LQAAAPKTAQQTQEEAAGLSATQNGAGKPR